MKNIILILLVNFMVVSFCNGQDNSSQFNKKNALKINPIGLGNAKLQLTYERFLGDRNSSVLISPSIIIKESNNESKRGWEIMGQYRFFLSHFRKDKQKTFLGIHNYGFYAGLYGLYFNYNEDYIRYYWDKPNNVQKEEEATKEINAVEGGVLSGIQIDITPRILIDFYVGVGIKDTKVKDSFLDNNPSPENIESYGIFDPERKGIKPKFGLLLGITF